MAMRLTSVCQLRKFFCRIGLGWACLLSFGFSLFAQQPKGAPVGNSTEETRAVGPVAPIPRQRALTSAALDGVVRERVNDTVTRPVPGARLQLLSSSGQAISFLASGDGVFRIVPLVPGEYQLRVEAQGYATLAIASLRLVADEVLTLEICLESSATTVGSSRLPRQGDLGPALAASAEISTGTYREFRHRLDSDPNYFSGLA